MEMELIDDGTVYNVSEENADIQVLDSNRYTRCRTCGLRLSLLTPPSITARYFLYMGLALPS